jgi:hypothetical protein
MTPPYQCPIHEDCNKKILPHCKDFDEFEPHRKIAGVFTHQGLGDHIECCGLVREIAKKYDEVKILCPHRHFELVSYMYRDNPNIVVLRQPPHVNTATKFKRVWNNMRDDKSMDGFPACYVQKLRMGVAPCFYHKVKMPYQKKFENFYFQRNLKEEEKIYDKLNPSKEKYIFIHDDVSRGFVLNVDTKYKIIKNDPSINMFHMTKLFENAEEIHCMSSSLFCLIDCIGGSPLLKTKINEVPKFLHWNIRRVNMGRDPYKYFGSSNWKII